MTSSWNPSRPINSIAAFRPPPSIPHTPSCRCHPLAFRIPHPAADTTLLGTMHRDLATFKPALTITTQLHQPASLSLRPNDRPIWVYLTPALGTTLISINRLHAKNVRWVGDITNDKGTMLLSLASLRTKFGWTRLTLQRFASIWDAIPKAAPPTPPLALRQQTLQWGPRPPAPPLPPPLPPPLRPSLLYLPHPLGRTVFVPTHGYETLHIPVHAMLVIPHHLIHQDGRLPILSYRIDRRTSLQTRQTQAGTEIAVTFWLELRKDSDIWYSPTPREARGRHRLVPIAGCAFLTDILFPTGPNASSSSPGPTHPGLNRAHRSPTAVKITVPSFSQLRGAPPTWPRPLQGASPPHESPACTACHRLADTTICLDCGEWRHTVCIPHCRAVPHHGKPTYGLHTLLLRGFAQSCCRDGSVTHQGTLDTLPLRDPYEYMLVTSHPRAANYIAY
ncbi:hypothetical protein DYB38_004584 [Aphanomyces astaci]|uniref:Uncharacterized protein n=1 Tax=Aphanomyces astaci TaxID=112090 RepID=A0A397CYI1_APHAT|nr:hypothetical protein DYB36_005652 [Aphanomyces astaci]RHY51358.1 hypothetical protein DYB38_004584 [Aphanomyces astaci]